ncbi:uncharacterized protein LOC129570663 [Sitodiplosis mosellana]|uniref:uncharacterized protein LOC129570663 n=1 Tax=Sitodiplosis mosellana TaxID=263140 RepID=UPI0024438CA1|nr:uncharacterized protein LOC129570663 [Sitodiplosis mosellana]
MQVAANNLRNMYISNDAKKTQDSDEFEPDLTLVPTYTQFLNDKNNKDWTLRSPPKATSWKHSPEIPSASSDGLIQVYMREQDINRMLNKGNIYFAQGKLHYAESTQRKRTF